MALAIDREWLPEERKWGLLLRAAEGYGVDAPDGGLAGAVVLARYGTTLASVGMMLVAERFGRRGLGQALLSHLLAEAGDVTVSLYATENGRPLYEKLGFRTVGKSVTFTGLFRRNPQQPATGSAAEPATEATGPAAGATTRPAAAADLRAIIEVDEAAFGTDRGHILRELPAFAEQLRVLAAGGKIIGYAGAWLNGNITVIGPIVAPDGPGAQLLIGDLARNVAGPLRLDLDPDRTELPSWATAHGMRRAGQTSFMVRGSWPPPGHRDRLYAPLTVALT